MHAIYQNVPLLDKLCQHANKCKTSLGRTNVNLHIILSYIRDKWHMH